MTICKVPSRLAMAAVLLTAAFVTGCDDSKISRDDTSVEVVEGGDFEAPGLYPEFERQERVERIAALTGDANAGAAVFQTCATCHGVGGFGSPDGSIPRLAGQQPKVLIEKLVEISDGVRHRPEMEPYLPLIATDEQISALATFVSALPDPDVILHGPDGADGAAGEGEELFADYCISCHGQQGEGDGDARVPRIAGWNFDSVRRTLRLQRAQQTEIHETGMSDLVSMLNEGEIDALADYVSRLTPLASAP